MQPCDLDVCQHIRKRYATQEAVLQLNKMTTGDSVPNSTEEETMKMLVSAWDIPGFHEPLKVLKNADSPSISMGAKTG